jgi:NADPH2:quinone reductase
LKALLCEAFGPPESLVLKEVDAPALKPGHVRLQTQYCSVNFPDALMIQGLHQYRFEPPFIPGGELSGVVSELGAEVAGLAIGAPVTALSFSGGFAAEAVIPVERVHQLPVGVDMARACCLIGTYGTALHALAQRAALRPGETLLVLGAAGGSGAAAVQVGKLLGAHVIAAVGSEEKLAFALELGADQGFNYSNTPLKEAVGALTGKRGVDVIYDPVGGEYADPALRSMAWNGRYLVVGFASGTIPQFKGNLPLLKGCAILGVFTGEFLRREPESSRANVAQLIDWLGSGRLQPAVSSIVPLAQVPLALRRLLDRKAIGKIVASLGDSATSPPTS